MLLSHDACSNVESSYVNRITVESCFILSVVLHPKTQSTTTIGRHGREPVGRALSLLNVIHNCIRYSVDVFLLNSRM
jgi:hypothetical protein